MAISGFYRSWILLVPLIPSILVSIFNLYHLLTNRTLRLALHNHVIILLLICGLIEEVTDLSWQIHYYRTGTSLVSTPAFCYTWVYICGSMYISVFCLMAWASIERHILIFYPHCFGTKTKRLFFHYLPLALCIMYPIIFYFLMFFVIPCSSTIAYNRRFCNLYGCVTNHPIGSLWDSIGNYILTTFIIVIFSITLFLRVLYSRYRIRQRIEWRNYKKMAAQLLSISFLYTVMQLPPMSLYAAYSAGLPRSVASDYYTDSLFFSIWAVLFTPFACTVSLPELRTKCQRVLLFWRPRPVVVPAVLAMTRSKQVRTDAVIIANR